MTLRHGVIFKVRFPHKNSLYIQGNNQGNIWRGVQAMGNLWRDIHARGNL